MQLPSEYDNAVRLALVSPIRDFVAEVSHHGSYIVLRHTVAWMTLDGDDIRRNRYRTEYFQLRPLTVEFEKVTFR